MSISMGDRGPYESPAGAVVGNEFAEVAVEIDAQGNSTRLRVTDLKTERVRYLDALELEALVWLPEGHLAQLLDPSADRWKDGGTH
jgi:hypothetical protein